MYRHRCDTARRALNNPEQSVGAGFTPARNAQPARLESGKPQRLSPGIKYPGYSEADGIRFEFF